MNEHEDTVEHEAHISATPDTPTTEVVDAEHTAEELESIHTRNAFVRALDALLTDIRQRSYEGKITTTARWKKHSFQPEGMEAAAFVEEVLLYIQTHDHAEAQEVRGTLMAPKPFDVQLEGKNVSNDDPLPEPDVSDIALLMGKKAIHALFLTSENDDVATFVDVVRTESRVYPRPVAEDSFMNPPYLWSRAKTRKVYEKARALDAFKDIHVTRTSLGEPYYYSDLYLSDAQGAALAQWYGVEKGLNP